MGGMRIVFSDHARVKMEQRKIPRSFAIDTVTAPEIETPSYNFRIELYKKFGKNYLKVVIKHDDDSIVVITVHWVEKIQWI